MVVLGFSCHLDVAVGGAGPRLPPAILTGSPRDSLFPEELFIHISVRNGMSQLKISEKKIGSEKIREKVRDNQRSKKMHLSQSLQAARARRRQVASGTQCSLEGLCAGDTEHFHARPRWTSPWGTRDLPGSGPRPPSLPAGNTVGVARKRSVSGLSPCLLPGGRGQMSTWARAAGAGRCRPGSVFRGQEALGLGR